MKILCEQCSAKYSISESLLKKDVTRFRCKKCRHIMEVTREVPVVQTAQDALLDDEFDEALTGSGGEMEDEKTTISARPILPNDQEQGLVLRSALYDSANRAEAAAQEDVDTRVFNIGALQMLRAERKSARRSMDHAGAPVAVVSPGLVTPLPTPQPTMDLEALAEQALPEEAPAVPSSSSRAQALLGPPAPQDAYSQPRPSDALSPANGAAHMPVTPVAAPPADVFQHTAARSAAIHTPSGGLFDDGSDDSRERFKWLLVGVGSALLLLIMAGGFGAYLLLEEARRNRVTRGSTSANRLAPRPTSLVPVPVRAIQARKIRPRTPAPAIPTAPGQAAPKPRKRRAAPAIKRRRVRRKRRRYRRRRRAPRKVPKKKQATPLPLPPAGWKVPPPPPPPSDGKATQGSPSIDVNELNRVLKGKSK